VGQKLAGEAERNNEKGEVLTSTAMCDTGSI